MKHFDVLVVGAGHAGVEAALASGRCGAATALITFKHDDLGVMSCNPAIGGIGKGHLVREVDALDGMIARAADYAGIQFRLLNRSRGHAVRGPRVQADRKRYAEFVKEYVRNVPGVKVITAEVVDLKINGNRVSGVTLSDGTTIEASSVVITTGTFLGGRIHVGSEVFTAGREGSKASEKLGRRLRELAFHIGRLKTGTPARLVSKTIDWDRVGRQYGDEQPVMMSFENKAPIARQVFCGTTQTNEKTHEIIHKNLSLSAMCSGNIEGIGPRYCPSIEDKINRFEDKTSHQVYLEPESLDGDLVYPNGISTSLPANVQEMFIRTIVGLEDVEIRKHGYAIEYDYVDPRTLYATLMTRDVQGLFLAGQVNGTTGYEEAAAQGLVAGLNSAAFAMGRDQAVLSRTNSYIGVMIDDLTTKGVSEPYRMFTSRAEYRLYLRADNADERLTRFGAEMGLVRSGRLRSFEEKAEKLDRFREVLKTTDPSTHLYEITGVSEPRSGQKRSCYQVLGLVECIDEPLGEYMRDTCGVPFEILDRLHAEATYEPYLDRQRSDIERLERSLSVRIPEHLDFFMISGLSAELRHKMSTARPATLGHAQRIEGMTPAALVLLLAAIKNHTDNPRVAQQNA